MATLVDSQSPWGALSGLLGTYVLPALGAGSTTDRSATVDERIRYGSLNGSGPNDPAQAKKAPTNLLEFIFGRQKGDAVAQPGTAAAPARAGLSTGGLIVLVVAVAIGAVWLWKKL